LSRKLLLQTVVPLVILLLGPTRIVVAHAQDADVSQSEQLPTPEQLPTGEQLPKPPSPSSSEAPAVPPAPGTPARPSLSLDALGVQPPGASSAPVDYNVSTAPRSAGNYLWPLLDVNAINFSLWAISYASGAPFAHVGPSVWKENLSNGFQWDDNEFEVNQFAHPYQGGMYFTAARVNGLNFWEAVPYTLFGSLTWEFFAETEQPSTNDWLTTTWGGFMFGETLYRLSNSILDDSTSGSTRFWKEFAALAVNPVNGIDRLISGQAWADGPPGEQVPLGVDLRLGPDGIGLSEGTGWGKTIRAWIRFDYGDLYAKPAVQTPFEAFNLSGQLSFGSSIFGQGIDGTGVLLANRFFMGPNSVNLIAWVLSFEYFTNGTTKVFTRESSGVYQLGEMGTGPSWFGRLTLGSGFTLDTELDVLAVPTGAITSPYAKFEANRSYNYGVGGALKAEVNLRHERLGRLYAKADRYLYYIVDGARGVEHVGVLELGAYANIYAGHGIGVTAMRYDRNSYYDDYPDLFDAFWSGQVHYEVEF
jgi:hypothetical protein